MYEDVSVAGRHMTKVTRNDPQAKSVEAAEALGSHDDPVLREDQRAYLAYQVAEDAKKQLIAWAKWIIGTCALIIGVLGVETYLDVQTKIAAAIEK